MLHSVWHLKSRDNVKFWHIGYAHTKKLSKASGQLLTKDPILNGPQGNFGLFWEILRFENSSVEDKIF